MNTNPDITPADRDDAPRRNRILVVDDERLVLATLSRGLERQGYDVACAATPAEAIGAIESTAIDLAILDVRLGNESGLDLARELGTRSTVPIVFLSAFGDSDYVDRAVKDGGYAYLVKPVTAAQVAPVIETALARGRAFAALRQSEENLRNALGRERQVSIAVGLVMERSRIPSHEAFEVLRARARTERRRIFEVAGEIIRSVETLNGVAAPTRETPHPPRSGAPK